LASTQWYNFKVAFPTAKREWICSYVDFFEPTSPRLLQTCLGWSDSLHNSTPEDALTFNLNHIYLSMPSVILSFSTSTKKLLFLLHYSPTLQLSSSSCDIEKIFFISSPRSSPRFFLQAARKTRLPIKKLIHKTHICLLWFRRNKYSLALCTRREKKATQTMFFNTK
jgi:hypothetical protein